MTGSRRRSRSAASAQATRPAVTPRIRPAVPSAPPQDGSSRAPPIRPLTSIAQKSVLSQGRTRKPQAVRSAKQASETAPSRSAGARAHCPPRWARRRTTRATVGGTPSTRGHSQTAAATPSRAAAQARELLRSSVRGRPEGSASERPRGTAGCSAETTRARQSGSGLPWTRAVRTGESSAVAARATRQTAPPSARRPSSKGPPERSPNARWTSQVTATASTPMSRICHPNHEPRPMTVPRAAPTPVSGKTMPETGSTVS